MIKIATVCSGIGSPEQALTNLGIKHEISFACEIDKYARKTYLANFQPNLMLEDMSKQTWERSDIFRREDKLYSDLFIGGIPCQSFSLAGKRLGELDPRGLLFYDFHRYVKIQQPKYFIIENVKGLLSDDKGKTFRNWIQLLGRSENTHINMFNHPDSLEYNLHWTVLNTKDFGLPQNRERVFLVGIRSDLPNTFRFPIGWRLDKGLKDVLENNVDEKYYLSDKYLNAVINHSDRHQEKGNGFKFDPNEGDGIAVSITTKAGQRTTDNYIKEPVCVAMRGRDPDNPSARITGQKNVQTLERNSQGTTNTITSVQKDNLILEPKIYQTPRGNNKGGLHEISPTITANSFEHNNHVVEKVIQLNASKESGGKQPYQHNRVYDDSGLMTCLDTDSGRKSIYTDTRIRRLTPLECFRLQGFPDEFFYKAKEVNSDTQLYKQAGNTISVPVIQAIIKNLLYES